MFILTHPVNFSYEKERCKKYDLIFVSVGSGNNKMLSLVGMQIPEKYKEKFNVSSELLPL